MKAFFQTIVHRVLAHRACVKNQKLLRIGQKTPPYPLRILSAPIKIFFLLLALGLSVNVWGETYTISFNKGTTSGTSIGAKLPAQASTLCSSGSDNIVSFTGDGAYYNTSGCGIRIAKNNGAGTFTITLSNTIQAATISKVIVYASKVANNTTSALTVTPTSSAGTGNYSPTNFDNSTLPAYSTEHSGSLSYKLSDITINGSLTSLTFSAPSNGLVHLHQIDIVTAEAPTTKRIYMKSGFDGWSNAKYAVYDATNKTWLDHFMTEDCDGYYYDDIPESCTTVVLGRFNTTKQSQPTGDWNTGAVDMWNQSVDVTYGESNLFTTKGYGTYGDDNGKAYGDLSNLYSIGEATYTNCTLSSGTWPICAQESGTEFNLVISADEGYKLNSGVTASGCTAVWTPALIQDATSGTLHVTITGDNASIAVGATSDEYTVTWMANGIEHDSKTDYSYNNALVMPATNPQSCDRNHFIGWTANSSYTNTTAPSDLFTEAGEKVVTADVTYYAVYAQLSKNSEETFTSKLAYSGGTTTNMTGNNDAALLGLDEHRWSIVGAKNNGSGLPGLNTSGYIALYGNASGGNTITVTSLTGVTIPNIKVYVKTGKDYNDNYVIKVNDTPISGTDGSYIINATSFVIGNANENTTQVHIDSIVIDNSITYTSYSTACTVPTWTMSFVNQGHGAQVASKDVPHNTTTSAPDAPVATGWAFGGWYKEATCENAWDFSNDVVTRDITLYAKWTCGWKVAIPVIDRRLL